MEPYLHLMNRQQNHAHLVNETAAVVSRSPPLGKMFLVWLTLVVTFVVAYGTDWIGRGDTSASTVPIPLLVVLLVVAVVTLSAAVAWLRIRTLRRRYLAALQEHTPDALLSVVDRAMKPLRKTYPSADAHAAQGRALAYALYGDEAQAQRELSAVDWRERAPIIQSIGILAEAMIELLCGRRPIRAAELTRRAQSLGEVNPHLPGAKKADHFKAMYIGVSEAIAGRATPGHWSVVERTAKTSGVPMAQLVALLGMRVRAEREGRMDEARALRATLERMAPHCAPLHLPVEAFDSEDASVETGPVSRALGSSVPYARSRVQNGKGWGLRFAFIGVGAWVLLIVLFVGFYKFYSQG